MRGANVAALLNGVDDHVREAQFAAERGDWKAALRQTEAANNRLTNFATEAIQAAYNSGETKKALADALGVPVSVLRGLTRTAAA